MSNIRIQKDKLIKLGHNIPKYDIHNIEANTGWFKCTKCNAQIYIDSWSHSITPSCWENDIFGDKYSYTGSTMEFNLTCDEVIILKIID